MSTQRYTTIASDVLTETEISRSRFLCFLAPAADEEAARGEIARVRTLHPRARHHCTAFVLGPDGRLQRTNDDGEPSGTAGAPMLEALLGGEVSDVVAVVVRYFGGILLGTGGLARAYRGAVAGALERAERVDRTRLGLHRVRTGYAAAAAIEGESRRRGWSVTADYGADVTLDIGVTPADEGPLRALVERITAGSAPVVATGSTWVTTMR